MKFPEKKILIQIAVVLGFVLIVLGVRFFSGNEDTWLCENGKWIRHGNPSASEPITPCVVNNIAEQNSVKNKSLTISSSSQDENIVYCFEHNGKIEYRIRGDNMGYNVCVFPRGRECEVSSYVEEQCPPTGASVLGLRTPLAYYCVDMGGEYRPTRDAFYKTAKERGNCVFLNGRTCSTDQLWNGICERSLPTTKELQTGVTTSISDAITMTDFPGEFSDNDPLLKTYGVSPEAIFKKNPSIFTLIRRFVPSFEQMEMRNFFPIIVVNLADKRKILLFGGCSSDGCSGTKRIAAYDPKKKKLYFLREQEDLSTLLIYGAPDTALRNALFAFYFSLE